ncbi:hypothetical protein ACGFIK_24110 [Micromonospora sp. NPDC048871]|uniref:hypothetical protein n=1 Tax=unclassified Micromonospora TaxID=2617518 RepID=UPI002E0F2503|nr:hypothetical protein OIE53_07125 [Micromonospora sp. NBC_01739]
MDPVTLVVGALAAGALQGTGEAAASAVKDAYQALKAAVAARFADRPSGQLVLQEHEQDPEVYAAPLAKQVRAAGADQDPRIVELAQALMALLNEQGAGSAKYQVRLDGAKGVQVGDGNTQTNTFE